MVMCELYKSMDLSRHCLFLQFMPQTPHIIGRERIWMTFIDIPYLNGVDVW